jgi:L-lactate dehydrogenase complex protein LldE
MQVGLFIPCYIDQLYPQVGLATVEILERFGATIDFPAAQTCCGQPMANTGCTDLAAPFAFKFLEIFKDHEYVVAPSGSCVAMVRHHYEEYLHGQPGFEELKHKTYELCEFLHDVLRVERVEGRFPFRVGVHQSCHGLRELRLGASSERVVPPFNKVRRLLDSLEGIELVELARTDECCGFGGTFAVSEEAISCMMGRDRVHDHVQAGAEVLTAGDMSCLMHLEGLIRRDRTPLKVMHVAEILAEATASSKLNNEKAAMNRRSPNLECGNSVPLSGAAVAARSPENEI